MAAWIISAIAQYSSLILLRKSRAGSQLPQAFFIADTVLLRIRPVFLMWPDTSFGQLDIQAQQHNTSSSLRISFSDSDRMQQARSSVHLSSV